MRTTRPEEAPVPDEPQALGELLEEAARRLVLARAAAAGRGTKSPTSAAETRKLAASIHSAVVAPNAATRMPPSGAPTRVEPCWIAARIPLARSMRAPASSTTSGRSAARAVAPGASRSAPSEHERQELPELDPDRRVQERDRRDGRRAGEVGDDARRPEAEPVDDDAAEEGREHDRQEVEEDGEAGERRAPGRGQDVPGDRELRDGVSRERDRRPRRTARREVPASAPAARYASRSLRRLSRAAAGRSPRLTAAPASSGRRTSSPPPALLRGHRPAPVPAGHQTSRCVGDLRHGRDFARRLETRETGRAQRLVEAIDRGVDVA